MRGTLEGVPRLVETLTAAKSGATFLFSLGPDHTGRALRRAFRPGFLRKVARTSVVTHYGLRSLLYGTLLPGPDIGRRAGHIMRMARDRGFETGVHCYDHVLWQDNVRDRDALWTRRQMELAVERFERVLGTQPAVHGAAGWQMNDAAFALEAELGFAAASDTRGRGPFLPALPGSASCVPQLPTTLPTMDELLGHPGIDERNVHQEILRRTADARSGHVFTLHAELEGLRLLPSLQRLLDGWREQGYELVELGSAIRDEDRSLLPRCRVETGELPGRTGTVAIQGDVLP